MASIRVKFEQRDHETVVNIPTLYHGPIHTLFEATLDEIASKAEIAGDTAIRYAKTSRSGFDRARKGVKHANGKSRHIIDKELVDVLGGYDQGHVRRCLIKRVGEATITGIKRRDLLWIAQIAGVHNMRQMRRRHPKAKLRHRLVSVRRSLLWQSEMIPA